MQSCWCYYLCWRLDKNHMAFLKESHVLSIKKEGKDPHGLLLLLFACGAFYCYSLSKNPANCFSFLILIAEQWVEITLRYDRYSKAFFSPLTPFLSSSKYLSQVIFLNYLPMQLYRKSVTNPLLMVRIARNILILKNQIWNCNLGIKKKKKDTASVESPAPSKAKFTRLRHSTTLTPIYSPIVLPFPGSPSTAKEGFCNVIPVTLNTEGYFQMNFTCSNNHSFMGQEVQKISVLWLQCTKAFVLEVPHSNGVR